MLPKISVQLYSLREQMKDGNHLPILKKLAETGFAGVELAGFYGMAPRDLRTAIEGMGMAVSSSHHFPCPTAENINQLIDQLGELGLKELISGFGAPHFETLETIQAAADKLNNLIAPLQRAGMTLVTHNHDWEFRRRRGRFNYEYLIDLVPSLQLEIDTYWASNFDAEDPAKIVGMFRDRTPFLHIKDGPLTEPREQNFVAVGTGKMDIPAVIKAANPAVLRWAVIEIDRCDTDMLTAVIDSYNYLAATRLAVGRTKPT